MRSFDEKPYVEISYCKEQCEFYNKCLARKENCVKLIFDKILFTLAPHEEKVIRLSFGIGCPSENPPYVIKNEIAACSAERVEQIQAKALRKLRYPRCSRSLITTNVGLILFSQEETNYSRLWRAILGDSRPQHELYQEFAIAKVEENSKAEIDKQKEKETDLRACSWESIQDKAFDITIEELDLSVRSYICLKRAGINTVEDLSQKTYKQMLEVKDLRKKSLEEVIQKLESLGISLKSTTFND